MKCEDAIIHIEQKSMDVLMMLASCPGAVVSRAEILDAIWPDSPSADQALNRAISNLRRAFSDRPQSPSIIETIPGRGYRLIAECRPSSVQFSLRSAESIPWRNKNPKAAAAVLGSIAVVVAGGVVLETFDTPSNPVKKESSLRVLQSPLHVIYVPPTIVTADAKVPEMEQTARKIANAVNSSLEKGDYVIIGTDEPALTRTASILDWSNRAKAFGITRMLGVEVIAREGMLSVHLYIRDTEFDAFLWHQTLHHSDPENIQPLLTTIEKTLLDETRDFLPHPLDGDQPAARPGIS